MSLDRRILRPLGVLSLFVSLPILEASLMAARAFIQEGDALRAFLGSAGSLSAVLLLVAGVSLCANRHAGRRIAYWGCAGSVAAHTWGALIGLVGGHGVLYGIGYPVAMVLLLRATPSSGLPADPRDPEARPDSPHDQGALRSAVA